MKVKEVLDLLTKNSSMIGVLFKRDGCEDVEVDASDVLNGDYGGFDEAEIRSISPTWMYLIIELC